MSIEPYYDDGQITVYHADCRDVLPTLPKCDLLLTDPPYGIDAAKGGAHSSIRDSNEWPAMDWDAARCPEAVLLALSMAEEAMVWGGNYYSDVLPVSSGWLAWVKPEAETGFSLADMELCWTSGTFAARVKRLARRDGNDHPTQKPLALFKWCLGFFPDAQTILDPFAGSLTTAVAAKHLGRRCIAIEREEKYVIAGLERLRQGVLL